jgi:hypothetical protein
MLSNDRGISLACQREFTRCADICESNAAILLSINTFRYLGTGATDNILRCEKEENITAEAHLIGFRRERERERERNSVAIRLQSCFKKKKRKKKKKE